MSVFKTNDIIGRTTVYFCGSEIKSAVIDHAEHTITFTYRDERSVTRRLGFSPSSCEVSYDGRLLYCAVDGEALRCYEIEPFQLKWEFGGTVNSLVPADDGIIADIYAGKVCFARQTDADGREIFDKIQQISEKLVKLSADEGHVLYSRDLGNIRDITHDHLLARGEDGQFYILRKSDMSVVGSYPLDDPARYFEACCVKDGKLTEFRTVRAYGSLYNTEEVVLDITLPDEVIACAEKYADECEEKYKQLCECRTKYDFSDPRLKGIVTADGEIDNHERFTEFTSLYLVPYSSENAEVCCSLCGDAMSDGYAALDGSKHICGSCFDSFEEILHFKKLGNISDDFAEQMKYNERADRCRSSHPLVPFDSEDFAYLITGGIARITRKMTDSRTETWFHMIDTFFCEYIGQLEKSVLKDCNVEEITITVIDANESSEDCMELMIDRNGTKAAAYPSVTHAGNAGVEAFRVVLRDFRYDNLTENPFAPFCTDFEIVDTLNNKHIKDRSTLLDIFAKAVSACGGRVIYLADIDYDSVGRVYFATASENGAVLNDLLRRFMYSCSSSAFYAEGFGAVFCSRLGYAVVGGTHEFTEKARDMLHNIGCLGTSEFTKRYYIYYQPDMSDFYSRKRALVTWATRSDENPDGLYDILHAHIFCTHNKQFISDGTKCGCIHCVEGFDGSEIKDWIDDGRTALCPKCMTDSVIPENCGYPIDEDFLLKMKKFWF